MDTIFRSDGIAGSSTPLELLETIGCGCNLPELLEAAEDVKRCIALS